MKEHCVSRSAAAIFLAAVTSCTQAVSTEAEGDQRLSERAEQASPSPAPYHEIYDLPSDWSGSVRVRMYVCWLGGLADNNDKTCAVEPGWTLVGGGATVHRDYNSTAGALLTGSFPEFQYNRWRATSKSHIYQVPHMLWVAAIGMKLGNLSASQLQSNMIVSVAQSQGSQSHPSVSSPVPSGMLLIGGGARALYSGAGQLLTESYPFGNSWHAKSKDHHFADPGQVLAYAIAINQCPTGFGACLEASSGATSVTCSGGLCCNGQTPAYPFANNCPLQVAMPTTMWATTSVGGRSLYNGAGRLFFALSPYFPFDQEPLGPPYNGSAPVVSVHTKDHHYADSGSAIGYFVTLRKYYTGPPPAP
jgi:hypothetical protein